jgi:SAM-dependent methyltransferase
MSNPLSEWDHEYRRGGIPSSSRLDPSGVLLWAIANWRLLTGTDLPHAALDVGCGAGRNSSYLASLGIKVVGFDSSQVAITNANERIEASQQTPRRNPTFLLHDLVQGLPVPTASVDFIADIFVYKHQLSPATRAQYRTEMDRVLADGGRVLLSLAGRDDGYYSTCPDYNPPEISTEANPKTILDPTPMIGSVLFSPDDIVAEMADHFTLEMLWHKRKVGSMHGQTYMRSTMATLWRRPAKE